MAAPSIETNNRIIFKAADQETTAVFKISAIAWVSNGGADLDIAADDDMLLEDGSGVEIIGMRAEATANDLKISFPEPIIAHGLKAEDLDGGVLYVYGKRV